MNIIKRFITMLLCALLCAPIALARQAQDNQVNTTTASQAVTIIIQKEKVRFTAQKAVQEMQLQIFNQSGETVYDSGVINESEINWQLHNANGEAIKSGLYAYTLTIKEVGAETARVRRGHFIVDRAKDRDNMADKLWMTSQNDNGVGTELTVARDESVTIAGTTTPRPANTTGVDGSGRNQENGNSIAKPEGENVKAKKDKKEAPANLTIAGTGVAGQIVKFTSEEEIGVSEISEVDGSVGIGTTTPQPGFRLHVNGPTFLTPFGSMGDVTFSTPNGELGMGILMGPRNEDGSANGPRADIRFNGSTLKLVAGPNGGPPSPANGITVDTAGNVGIGALAPKAGWRFHVNGNTIITPGGSGGDVAFGTPNGETGMAITRRSEDGTSIGPRADIRFDGSTLKLLAGPVGGPPGIDRGISINTDGNVGIGTATPAVKLHVAGANIVESSVQSTDERAILSLNSTINGENRVWTLENGVFGEAGKFAIFDRTAFKARLSIDTNGLVAVSALRITGGSDFAENFDVNATEAIATKVEAGMVVSIDPTTAGKLTLSTQAYDRRVAGIISGAGGVNPGMMMSQEGTLADGRHPVALSGRVYCWVDASQGAIEPGDLLTSSATPGHAMKVTDREKAQGAIIGKAMTSLKAGKGLVLVLVTLQ